MMSLNYFCYVCCEMQVMPPLVWTLLPSLEQAFYLQVTYRCLVGVCVCVCVCLFRYLFEGVGFLVSSILISNISEIKRINQNGIKKM